MSKHIIRLYFEYFTPIIHFADIEKHIEIILKHWIQINQQTY